MEMKKLDIPKRLSHVDLTDVHIDWRHVSHNVNIYVYCQENSTTSGIDTLWTEYGKHHQYMTRKFSFQGNAI